MTYLRETQRWMAALVRQRRSLPPDPHLAEAAALHVEGNDRLTPVELLEIYREQFWLRHTASLLEDFPGLSGILGQEDWERLVEEYLEEIAPTSWTLRDLGMRLPAHVERSTWLPHHRLCLDMARLEWAFVELFDAPDAPLLDVRKLAAIPEDAFQTARIVLNPAVALLPVKYPVPELRRTLQRRSPETKIPDPHPQNLVLYRGADLALYHATVSDAAFGLLSDLREGVPLLPACDRTVQRMPEAAAELEENAGAWFLDWGRRGWIIDVVT